MWKTETFAEKENPLSPRGETTEVSHISAVAMAKIHELQFELLDHPSYSPDLAQSVFLLFLYLKIASGGQRFSSNEEAIITFVNNYFAEKNAEYYLDRLQRWEHRWEKCIELQGDYVEKNFF